MAATKEEATKTRKLQEVVEMYMLLTCDKNSQL